MDDIELESLKQQIFESDDPNIIAEREALLVSMKLLGGEALEKKIEYRRKVSSFAYKADLYGPGWVILAAFIGLAAFCVYHVMYVL